MKASTILRAAVTALAFGSLGAQESQAQSLLNPLTWFSPPPTYRPASACANGQCPPQQLYRPVATTKVPAYVPVNGYSNGVVPTSNCPNGLCPTGSCANGSCATSGVTCVNGQCFQPGNCPGGMCPVNAPVPYTNTTNYPPSVGYPQVPVTGSPYYSNQFGTQTNYAPVINRPLPNVQTGPVYYNNQWQNEGWQAPNYQAPNYSAPSYLPPQWNTGMNTNPGPSYVPPFRGRAASNFDGDLR